MTNPLRKHFDGPLWLPLAGGLAVATLLTLPHALTWRLQEPVRAQARSLGRPIPGFSLFGMGQDLDESFYAGRAREAADSWLPYSPYIAENRTPRLLLTNLAGFLFLGRLQRLTGRPEPAWLAARFVLLLAWVWLLYGLLYRASRKPRAALTAAAALVLFGDLFRLPTQWRELFAAGWGDGALRLLMVRGPHNLYLGPVRLLGPCFTFAALLGAGRLALNLLDDEKSNPRSWLR
ncbi:MAG: hypothetical protein PHF00_10290, partial [Elusimicrobia bacterium]|nr:hypothetical protein [Elusimicrobiota bacterium]